LKYNNPVLQWSPKSRETPEGDRGDCKTVLALSDIVTLSRSQPVEREVARYACGGLNRVGMQSGGPSIETETAFGRSIM
jgi:hypothetical protein